SLSLTRHHPTATLLPYTTLFRSRALQVADAGDAGGKVPPGCRQQGCFTYLAAKLITQAVLAGKLSQAQGGDKAATLGQAHVKQVDRKSTRLNSSHRTISYAVFCL